MVSVEMPEEVRMRADAPFDYLRLRGALAERRLTYRELARVSGLSVSLINMLMTGTRTPGELARIKLGWGLTALGIDPAMAFGISSADGAHGQKESR